MRKTMLRYCGALGSLLGPLLLQACEDSGTLVCEPVTAPDGTVENRCYDYAGLGKSSLAQMNAEAPGANCPGGGKRIDTGFDDNANGVLDPSEVDASTYICDGEPGAPGHDALSEATPLEPGEDCENGGVRVDFGHDVDGSGSLSAEETAGSYVLCNGAAGADGKDGVDGAAGPQGPQGEIGPEGPAGAVGAAGPQGPPGEEGPPGEKGPSGEQGPPGVGDDSGSLIAFASGPPATMTNLLGGSVGEVVIVGFGETATTFLEDGNIDSSLLDSLAFSVPNDGTLTSIAAFFSSTQEKGIVDTLTITARVFASSPPSDLFQPVPGAEVQIGIVTGDIVKGDTFNDRASLNIPIAAQTRMLLVFEISSNGLIAQSITGTFSGGIVVE